MYYRNICYALSPRFKASCASRASFKTLLEGAGVEASEAFPGPWAAFALIVMSAANMVTSIFVLNIAVSFSIRAKMPLVAGFHALCSGGMHNMELFANEAGKTKPQSDFNRVAAAW